MLSNKIKDEIDHWIHKFPEGKQQSAIISSLHAVQHYNGGYLTTELMIDVADYLDVQKIQVFEVASWSIHYRR